MDSLRSPFGQHFVLSISASLRFHDAAAKIDSARLARERCGVRWQRGTAQACPDDTAVERGKDDLRPESTLRHATAVSRYRLPRALHDAAAHANASGGGCFSSLGSGGGFLVACNAFLGH